MKVLHVLETSLPDTGGYTIRARYITEFQRRLGLDPVVVTSPLFPAKDPSVAVETRNGITHHRTNRIRPPSSARTKLGSFALRARMLSRYRHAVLDIAERERPDILHAHSSYSNAFAASLAARRLNLPLVYEVRTLWGESAVVEDGLRPDSWKHRLLWWFELEAMRRADLVVPIAAGIRDELIRRGVPAGKLEVVPNGVDCSAFVPGARDDARAAAVDLNGRFVVGFIGTLRRLEGLRTLVDAVRICQAQQRRVGLVIVGDGPDRRALQEQASQLGVVDATFTGTVPHGDVNSWYSIMDVIVYPRMRAVINERVTPLKPLEAMALGKVCIGSDVGGLTELIRHDETGLIFPAEDATALAASMGSLMDDGARMERLRATALERVRRERDWSAIVPRYRELYERVARRRAN